eukprot:643437-Pyramimonas_sp.AAC.1
MMIRAPLPALFDVNMMAPLPASSPDRPRAVLDGLDWPLRLASAFNHMEEPCSRRGQAEERRRMKG